MAPGSSYLDRTPAPALAGLASSVWIQRVGAEPIAQRSVPHGGAEVLCVLGDEPRLLGPLTAARYRQLPAGGTVVGVRLRPGVLGGLLPGMPADELADEDVSGAEVWRDLARLTDVLGDAPSPHAALDRLQALLARSIGEPDPVVGEAVRHLMPWRGGTAVLPDLLPVSERQLRRRCRAAIGMGPKELQRTLRFHGFTARVQAAVDAGAPGDLALWAVEAGYHDQAHLTRECRRLAGVTPAEFLAQYRAACGGADDHDHAAAYRPMLGRDGRSVQERTAPPT
ncbi:helix-turn-helix domain-containing protein [Actinomycetospora sp. CA-053990]|uniref:helix-turn-helix domain-containing protein n=1 Tax=Actinomycetospora sp. CA-053990 TaxID=3239891 RepID=UPI003D8EEEA6